MTMKQYNWIKANNAEGDEIFVRQVESDSKLWLDDRGRIYDIGDLDFTQCFDEPKIFNLEEFEKRNKEINQQYQESQAMYMEMLSKMDANSIADHKAKIDEREYWRKLRGDIALEIIRKSGDKGYRDTASHFAIIADTTRALFNELYDQDNEFFEDK